jgi:hypothetical protein
MPTDRYKAKQIKGKCSERVARPRAPPSSRASAAPLPDRNQQLNSAIAAAASAANLQQTSPGSCTHPLDRCPSRRQYLGATMPCKSGDFSVVGNPPSILRGTSPRPHPSGGGLSQEPSRLAPAAVVENAVIET